MSIIKIIKIRVVCFLLLIILCDFSIAFSLDDIREITYKNVGSQLTGEELNINKNRGNYTFSGLTRELPYKVTEEDLGINKLIITENEKKTSVKVVVTEAARKVDLDGWTVLEPAEDARMIYVSSSGGDDDNDGLSPDSPVKTLQAGIDLVRSGVDSVNGKIYPDWLLLKRGDVWNETLNWRKSGRSLEESTVITCYGDAEKPRPAISRVRLHGGASWRGAPIAHYWAIVGLRITDGISMLENSKNFLLEDCLIETSQTNLQSSDIVDTDIRRNIIRGNYSRDGSHAQGMYTSSVRGLLLEENILDHNGWWNPVRGADDYEQYNSGEDYSEGDFVIYQDRLYQSREDNPDGRPGESDCWVRRGQPTIFNHNFYIQSNCQRVRVWRNIITRASSHGIQLRPGGVISENIFAKNPLTAFNTGSEGIERPELTQKFTKNVAIKGNDIGRDPVGSSRAWGVEVGGNVSVENNIFANDISEGSGGFAIQVRSDWNPENLSIKNNIVYEWINSIDVRGTDETNSGVTIENNIVHNNRRRTIRLNTVFSSDSVMLSGNQYYSKDYNLTAGSSMSKQQWLDKIESDAVFEKPEFVNPERDLASYNAALGGEESFVSFIRSAKEQSRNNWRWDYSPVRILDYFTEGFSLDKERGPPDSVSDLEAETPEPQVDCGIKLFWTAPGNYEGWKDNTGGYYEVRYATYSVKNSSWSWWNSIPTDDSSYYKGTVYIENPLSVGEKEERLIKGMFPGKTFYVGIRAFNAEGKPGGLNKNLAAIEEQQLYAVAGDTVPYAPSGLVIERSEGQVNLGWDESFSPNIEEYRIYRSQISGVYDTVINSLEADSDFYACSHEFDEEKYYAISAVDINGYESDIVCFDPDEVPPEIIDRTPRSRAYGTRKIKAWVRDDRNVVDVMGRFRPLGSDFEGYELDFFPDPDFSENYAGTAKIDEDKINHKGFEYCISAYDGTNKTEQEWVRIKAPSGIPTQSFITPDNPQLTFGREVEEVLITDVRGNKVFESSKGDSGNIKWKPSDGSGISIESGIYLFRALTEDGYKYGTVVIAK